MKQLPRALVLVVAIGIMGIWYWKHLDGLSDLGGFNSARQEARERRERGSANRQGPLAADLLKANREAIDSDADEARSLDGADESTAIGD